MELQKNSLAIRLYNGSMWLRGRLLDKKPFDPEDLISRRYFGSDEEYSVYLKRKGFNHQYLNENSSIDVCSLVRRYLFGALTLSVYAFFYVYMFFALFWYNISSFGVGYALLGFGWFLFLFVIVAACVALLVGGIWVTTETPVLTVIKDSVQNTVAKSSILRVIAERYKSLKDKTCVLVRVKGE